MLPPCKFSNFHDKFSDQQIAHETETRRLTNAALRRQERNQRHGRFKKRANEAKVAHITAVMLHEFAHVLDFRGKLIITVNGVYTSDGVGPERMANTWAEWFLRFFSFLKKFF